MYSQWHYGWELLIDRILKQAPDSLSGPNIAALQIAADFILAVRPNLDCSMIAALVDILIDILYSLHRGTDLNINIGVVFAGQVWVIRHNLAVVKVHGLTVTAQY